MLKWRLKEMNLKEKIKKEYEGVVSIDTLRNLIRDTIDRELSSNLFIDGLSTEKLEYMIESLVFRTFIDEELEDIEFKSIEKLISVACKTHLITNGLDELKKKSLSDVLWSVIFDYMGIEYFCDIDGTEEILDCSPNLNHVLDTEVAIESGCIPDIAYDTISTRELIDSITEIITYFFKDKVEK